MHTIVLDLHGPYKLALHRRWYNASEPGGQYGMRSPEKHPRSTEVALVSGSEGTGCHEGRLQLEVGPYPWMDPPIAASPQSETQAVGTPSPS